MFLSEEFGFNFDLFETNLINILILASLIVFVFKGVFDSNVEDRRKQIVKYLDTLSYNLVIADIEKINAEIKFDQLRNYLALKAYTLSQDKAILLDKRYENVQQDLQNLFSVTLQSIATSGEAKLQFLKKYLIIRLLGKLIVKINKSTTTEHSQMLKNSINSLIVKV